jgi:hypothetical protein
MIFTIIIYSRDHGTNSYAEFQLGLQNSINTVIRVYVLVPVLAKSLYVLVRALPVLERVPVLIVCAICPF